MPRPTLLFLRSGLIFLCLAMLLGLLLALPLDWPGAAWRAGLRPGFYHALAVGWLTQLVFGVAFWLFPTASPERPHGREGLVRISFWALNLGLALRLVAEPWQIVGRSGTWIGFALAASALLQLLAASAFAVAILPRVRPR